MQKQLVEKERILAQIPLGFQFLDATTKIRENFCNNRTLQMLVKSFFRQNVAIEVNFDSSYENFMSLFVKWEIIL